ncbi:MAG: AMP phosphorylase [Promethearchaeota archaeon]|nr:MAG: AMP phosphorylase [Candidatus Lokiarchaeota archaeon]
MKLKIKEIQFETYNQQNVVLNHLDAAKLNKKAGERIIIKNIHSEKLDEKHWIGIIEISHSDKIIAPGELGVFADTLKKMGNLETQKEVRVKPAEPPDSYRFIQKKVKGEKLKEEEINDIINDSVSGLLSRIELSSFITGVSIHGMSNREMISLTLAEKRSGEELNFGPNVFDKHSTGGVPGNKVSLIIVPIVAAAGLIIPKTSTRAITSPSGTADSMEVLAPVSFPSEKVKEIVGKINSCIIWGGALNFAPADNILIEVERPLHLDPWGLMIPSILAKKLSMGVKKIVLDLPVGKGTKFPTVDDGKKFALVFKQIAKRVGIEAECALTLAHQPIGHKIGPALEAKEALTLLRDYSAGPNSLIEKSTSLAGILLEMGGKAQKGEGHNLAKKILKSGKAYEKMKEIIEIQGGNPDILPKEIKLGPYSKEIHSLKSGFITDVDNGIINKIAKTLGCPFSKTSGLDINKKQGGKIEKGERLFTMYSDSEEKLERAEKIYNQTGGPIILGGMVIERL